MGILLPFMDFGTTAVNPPGPSQFEDGNEFHDPPLPRNTEQLLYGPKHTQESSVIRLIQSSTI